MISVRSAFIIAAVAFVAGSFVASPELRAYAANTIRSGDIVDGEVKNADLGTNAVTTSKINDGAVKKADIATDAVDGEEIVGVTELTFAECVSNHPESYQPSKGLTIKCQVIGADVGEHVVATSNGNGDNDCFGVYSAKVVSLHGVEVVLVNGCTTAATLDIVRVSIILFDRD